MRGDNKVVLNDEAAVTFQSVTVEKPGSRHCREAINATCTQL